MLDRWRPARYAKIMLTGIRIYTSDELWRQILVDLNATICDAPGLADIDIDSLEIALPTPPIALKTAILAAMESADVVRRIFGRDIMLPRVPARIIALLDKNGGMSITELKDALGYSRDASTHVVDTAIYQLRRMFGRDFIRNKDGLYYIGEI